jgi:hypothetical protein
MGFRCSCGATSDKNHRASCAWKQLGEATPPAPQAAPTEQERTDAALKRGNPPAGIRPDKLQDGNGLHPANGETERHSEPLHPSSAAPRPEPSRDKRAEDAADALLLRLETIVGHTFEGALIPMSDAIQDALISFAAPPDAASARIEKLAARVRAREEALRTIIRIAQEAWQKNGD